MARKVGIDRISEMANRFGLGVELGLDIPGERRGLMPTRAWKQAVIGQPWMLGETLVAGIGQGFVLATPMQLATMTARLANGGFPVRPHVARDVAVRDTLQPRPEADPPRIDVSKRNLEVIVAAMDEVMQGERGTARSARIDIPGLPTMGGKTGTAQVRRITKREREQGVLDNEDLPWRYRDHALFVGFAPVEAPRYAISVVVAHGGGGSRSEERRVGKGCVSTCRSRWSPSH